MAPLGPDTHNGSHFFCQGPDIRYFRLYRSCGLCHSYSFLPSWNASSHRSEPPSEAAGTPKPLKWASLWARWICSYEGGWWARRGWRALAFHPGQDNPSQCVRPWISHVSWFLFWKTWSQNYRTNGFHGRPHLWIFFSISKSWISYILLAVRKTWNTYLDREMEILTFKNCLHVQCLFISLSFLLGLHSNSLDMLGWKSRFKNETPKSVMAKGRLPVWSRQDHRCQGGPHCSESLKQICWGHKTQWWSFRNTHVFVFESKTVFEQLPSCEKFQFKCSRCRPSKTIPIGAGLWACLAQRRAALAEEAVLEAPSSSPSLLYVAHPPHFLCSSQPLSLPGNLIMDSASLLYSDSYSFLIHTENHQSR